MDSHSNDARYIRAPSLKRGKNESGLNERVSLAIVLLIAFCSLSISIFIAGNYSVRSHIQPKKNIIGNDFEYNSNWIGNPLPNSFKLNETPKKKKQILQ